MEASMRRRRYPSDLTDPQWALVSPHIPPAKAGGRPRRTEMRAVLDAILYLLRTGCQWRQLPADFRPGRRCTAISGAGASPASGASLHRALYPLARAATCRNFGTTVAIMDGQVGQDERKGGVRGFDGHKRVKGRKRHILVDVLGLPLANRVEPANMSDPVAGSRLLAGLASLGRRSARSSRMLATRAASSPASSGAMAGNCGSSSAGSVFSRSLGRHGPSSAASRGS